MMSACILVSAVLRRMADEGKTRTNTYMESGEEEMREEKGEAPAIQINKWHRHSRRFFRAKRMQERENEEPREAAPCIDISFVIVELSLPAW